MKGSSMTTHMGNITIDNEVIGQYAGTVAMECFGIVGMGATVKGGLVKLLKSDSITKGIAVTLNNNKLTLDFRYRGIRGEHSCGIGQSDQQCKI